MKSDDENTKGKGGVKPANSVLAQGLQTVPTVETAGTEVFFQMYLSLNKFIKIVI
jgi:hypothetical protein